MQNERGFVSAAVLIAIVIGLIVVGGGAYYVTHQTPSQSTSGNFDNVQTLPTTNNNQVQQQTGNTSVQGTTNTNTTVPTPTPKPAPTASQTATYSNAQYGFSIDFAKDDPAKTVDYGSLHPFDTAPIVYSGYWITVNASSKSSDVANCTVAGKIHNVYQDSSSQLDNTYSKTVNGINFAVSDWHDGEPSYERNYTTLHNGMCFDIQIITVPSCSLCTSGRPTLESYKPQFDAMDKIAQTFKFIDPSQAVAPAVQVDGMSKYTESSFGYTFWYPNTWTVSEVGVQNPNMYGGGIVQKTLKISNGVKTVFIDQFHSNGRSIEDTNSAATYDNVNDVLYFFDPNSHTWMVNFPTGHSIGNPNSRTWTDANPQKTTNNPVAANVSNNTMGGLHIFDGAHQMPNPIANKIIPLSASNYLVVYTSTTASSNDYISLLYGLVQTIGATDASVATPVSAYDQINAIQQERTAFTK